MSIWAEIKKSINSNLNKPLNITLDEIKSDVTNLKKPLRKVLSVTGVPRNTTYSSQVLTLDDDPIVSIDGIGRIIQVIPIANSSPSNTLYGTTLVTIDDDIVINSEIRYASKSSSGKGSFIIDYTERDDDTCYSSIFGTATGFYLSSGGKVVGESNFINNDATLIAPIGVPFLNKFEIRLTQNITTKPEDVGVIVVYELYE